VQNPSSSPEPAFQVASPREFKLGALFAINAYGVLLATPVVFAVLAVTVMRLSVLTFLLPLLTLAFATFFLPFGFGNACVTRLVRRSLPPPAPDSRVVQLTTNPRMHAGVRAVLEDADDVGWLTITDTHLRFDGDSVRLALPLSDIQEIRLRNIGFRGFFLSASRLCVTSLKLGGLKSVEFSERSTMALPRSRKTTRELWQILSQKWRACRRPSPNE
jgi:hypothetical protein